MICRHAKAFVGRGTIDKLYETLQQKLSTQNNSGNVKLGVYFSSEPNGINEKYFKNYWYDVQLFRYGEPLELVGGTLHLLNIVVHLADIIKEMRGIPLHSPAEDAVDFIIQKCMLPTANEERYKTEL